MHPILYAKLPESRYHKGAETRWGLRDYSGAFTRVAMFSQNTAV